MERAGPPEQSLSEAAAAALIRGRRTVDRFLPERPDDDILLRAFELARWAPNHRLTEPWRFYLLGPQTRAGLVALNTRLVRQAKGEEAAAVKERKWGAVPGWFLLTCQKSADALQMQEDYAACCCAVQNVMLYLWVHGIGSKWTTGAVTRQPEFWECVGVDGGSEQCVGLFWYGYPAGSPQSLRHPAAEHIQHRP